MCIPLRTRGNTAPDLSWSVHLFSFRAREIIITLEHFKIYNVSYYLLHTIKNNVEVVRLAYSVSNVIKTAYFVNFLTLVDLNKVNLRTTNKIMLAVYLLKFKKIKDI